MALLTPRSQIPLSFTVLGPDGRLTQPWSFWFQSINESLPPVGTGYVVDGTASITGITTLYQGAAINRGSSPSVNSVYIADDTGQIFTVSGGVWQEQSPPLVGDVIKPAFSNYTTLSTVNGNAGTFGDANNVPVITVDEKGRITSVANTLINAANNIDSTALVFDAGVITGMFTLPSTAIITSIRCIVDAAFDGTPTASVGISGNHNKYMDTGDINLTIAGSWSVEPTNPPGGVEEALIITYSNGGATAGAARFVVCYSTPA